MRSAVVEFGFTQSLLDYSLFIKNTGISMVIILVYVGNLLIIVTDLQLIQGAKITIHNKFKIKNLGELKFFLGIEFTRYKRKYSLKLISDVGLLSFNLMVLLLT